MCASFSEHALQLRTVRMVLAINLIMFVVEMIAGWLAESTGLMADSLDMLADGAVYGLTLYAIGRSDKEKKLAAWSAALGQFMLSLWLAFGSCAALLGR